MALFIKDKYPTLKAFGRSDIYRMKQFYETYKDEKVVEYVMNRTMSPTMVAEYKLKLIDKELLENKED